MWKTLWKTPRFPVRKIIYIHGGMMAGLVSKRWDLTQIYGWPFKAMSICVFSWGKKLCSAWQFDAIWASKF